MSFLLGINTAVPDFAIGKQDFERFVADQSKADIQLLRKLRWLAEKSGIETRYAALPDYQSPNEALLYYRNGAPFRAGIAERMALYADLALHLSVKAAARLVSRFGAPTHLIYTSCTGLAAPGLEMSLLRALHLPANVFRHTVNFMGCHAALHALRTAHYICAAEPAARVLVVCTELCSLHYQDAIHDDALLANLLFGDGSAAVYMTGEADLQTPLLEFKDFYAELLASGEEDMSWALGEASFAMRLSSYVPQLLSTHIGTALHSAGVKWQQAPDHSWNWALHPGGKTILDQLGRELGLTEEQLAPSRGVLREFGNMSSASVLFVLQKILNQGELAHKPTILAAFGPGLSVEMAYAIPLNPTA